MSGSPPVQATCIVPVMMPELIVMPLALPTGVSVHVTTAGLAPATVLLLPLLPHPPDWDVAKTIETSAIAAPRIITLILPSRAHRLSFSCQSTATAWQRPDRGHWQLLNHRSRPPCPWPAKG